MPNLQDFLQCDVHTQAGGNCFVLIGFPIMSVPLKSRQNKMSYPQSILFCNNENCYKNIFRLIKIYCKYAASKFMFQFCKTAHEYTQIQSVL